GLALLVDRPVEDAGARLEHVAQALLGLAERGLGGSQAGRERLLDLGFQLRRLTLTRHVRDGQRQQQEQRSRRDLAVGYDWWQHHVLGREREDVVLPGVDPVQAPLQERATDL